MDGSEAAVRATLNHILNLIQVAAGGAERIDHVGAQTMRGLHAGLSAKRSEIVKQVLEQL
jgi:hypothetical protein